MRSLVPQQSSKKFKKTVKDKRDLLRPPSLTVKIESIYHLSDIAHALYKSDELAAYKLVIALRRFLITRLDDRTFPSQRPMKP